ncbi:uncharacterized protein LOC141622371 [Silene latifolia]|uniref:uncharacterized protein LOC141622371 n=1 Tax=Silene latifolia TaxID=37657 RepID=UPI003D779BA1
MESGGKMVDVIKQMLARPVQLADQVIKATVEAAVFKQECSELNSKASVLADLLRQAARSSADLYERPTRRIIDDTEQVLEKALSLAQKCRANGLLKRAFTIIPTTAFRKLFSQLENSVGNVSWLLRVSSGSGDDGGDFLGLPPIAANDPILCLIWEQIAIVSVGPIEDRADAASSLASLARDNARYGKLIIEEGGIGPLCKLVKEGNTVEAQEIAARALGLLGSNSDNVAHMVNAGVCSVLVKVLNDGPMKVQSTVAWAVAELAAQYPKCQEIFAQHNVVRLLVGHLAFETLQDHIKYVGPAKTPAVVAMANGDNRGGGHTMLRDIVARVQAAQTNGYAYDYGYGYGYGNGNGNSNGNGSSINEEISRVHRQRELEDPQVKASMKAMAARALCHLAKGNSAICRTICESRALLCLAVLLEKSSEEVKLNSAMALLEITAVAEKDSELRRSTFKPNSPACKAVVDQMLRIIDKADSSSHQLLIPCVKSIGNLARTFKATETRMIDPLVHLLEDKEAEVSREAAIALTKFAGTENYLHVDRSKAIIAAGGVKHLVQLVYFGEQIVQVPALELLSYMVLHVPNSEALAESEVLTVLVWASKQLHLVDDESKEALLLDAKSRLELYQSRVSR